MHILWMARKKAFLAFSCFSEGFASAEADSELSHRPLETLEEALSCIDMKNIYRRTMPSPGNRPLL